MRRKSLDTRLRSLFVLLLISILPSSVFASDSDLSCNPSADCLLRSWVPCGTLEYPLRTCPGPSFEEPNCVAVRAACRTKCGQLNDDANRYIHQYQTEINLISKSQKQNSDDIVESEKNILENQKYLVIQNNICQNFEILKSHMDSDINKKNEFIKSLNKVAHIENNDGIAFFKQIDQLDIQESDKLYFKTYFSIYKKTPNDIQLIVDQYILQNVSTGVDELINGVKIACDSSKTDQTNFIKTLIDKKIEHESKKISLKGDFDLLSGKIQQQELRKCR